MPPFTVNVKAASPLVLLMGEMLVNDGAGLFTVNALGDELPPPGAGLKTVIGNVPIA